MLEITPKFAAMFVAVTVLAVACGRFGATRDGDLDRNSDCQRARKAAQAGNFRVAATFYEKTLRQLPESSQLHLELGVLYDEKLSDPIPAIYHYRQFLELEPNSERRQVVQGFIERAQLALASKLPSASADPGELMRLQTEKAGLMQENAALRTRVMELERAPTTGPDAVAIPAATPVVVTQVTVVASNPAPAAGNRTYIVQKGDTLYSIAKHYYGSPTGWEKIYAANRGVLSSKDQLKVGQPLMIP